MDSKSVPPEKIEKPSESTNAQEHIQKEAERGSKPTIAGILLIISGVIALILWIPAIITIDISMIESMIDISQLQELNPDITIEQVKDMLVLCATIFCVLAIFPILGGILSLKRKHWGIALTGSILGLSTIFAVIIPGVLAFIGLILIIISRKEFQ